MSLDVLAPHLRDLVPAPRPRYVGVYFLISDDEQIVYIGQSIDIERRIPNHQHTRRCKRVMWIEVPLTDLDAYEGALLRAVRPRLNRGAPAHGGRDNEILAVLGLPTHADEFAHAAEYVRTVGHRRGPLPKIARELDATVGDLIGEERKAS